LEQPFINVASATPNTSNQLKKRCMHASSVFGESPFSHF
jgi:hypothetical protein